MPLQNRDCKVKLGREEFILYLHTRCVIDGAFLRRTVKGKIPLTQPSWRKNRVPFLNLLFHIDYLNKSEMTEKLGALTNVLAVILI